MASYLVTDIKDKVNQQIHNYDSLAINGIGWGNVNVDFICIGLVELCEQNLVQSGTQFPSLYQTAPCNRFDCRHL